MSTDLFPRDARRIGVRRLLAWMVVPAAFAGTAVTWWHWWDRATRELCLAHGTPLIRRCDGEWGFIVEDALVGLGCAIGAYLALEVLAILLRRLARPGPPTAVAAVPTRRESEGCVVADSLSRADSGWAASAPPHAAEPATSPRGSGGRRLAS